ncbi:hypothetical protein Poly30_09350 [Planctomycetes bacterium Poly30]|uniref:Glycosyltransferase RgtA/B/C/D-like domain-containing protein n=1 Tax=Saltatorellus ferox TaxID=2528018 RepID=A0A518EMW4_9BACT|nr:hypothetical protein Poly30_09350 [Planctomycetes bacterium Poly30]
MAVAAVVMGLVALWAFRLGPPNGLKRTSYSQAAATAERRVLYELGHWPWAYLDNASFGYTDMHECRAIELEGVVWQGAPGRARWRLLHMGGAEVFVDGTSVFRAQELLPLRSEPQVDEFDVEWDGEALDLRMAIAVDPGRADRFGHYRVWLEEQLDDGAWRRIPEHRLYAPSPAARPTAASARSDRWRHWTYRVAAFGFLLSLGLLVLHRLLGAARARPALFTIGGVAFVAAATVRALVLFQQAASEPSLWALARQTDNYLMFARAELAGSRSALLFSPGTTWWLLALTELLGPDLPRMLATSALFGALGVGVLAYGTGRMFGRSAACVAGAVGALYGPLVYYQTTLQAVAPLTTWLSCLPLLLVGLAEGRTRGKGLFGGSLIGAAALVRPTALALLPAILWAIFRRSTLNEVEREPRSGGTTAALLILGLLAVLLPQVVANHARNVPSFISANGPINLLIGNNRDSDGTYGLTDGFKEARSWKVRNGHSTAEQLLREFRMDPLRAVELQARKVGLLVTLDEASNAISYEDDGLARSSLLRLLSWDGRIGMPLIAWWGMAGILMELWRRGRGARAATEALAMCVVLYGLSTAIVLLEGRIRAPLLPLLIPFVASGLVTVVTRARAWLDWLPQLAAAGAATLGLLWCAEELPRKRYLDALPSDATPVDIRMENGLELVGWRMSSSLPVTGGYLHLDFFWRYGGPGASGVSGDGAWSPAIWLGLSRADAEKPFRPRVLKVGDRTYPHEPPVDWPEGKLLSEGYYLAIPRGEAGRIEIELAEVMGDGRSPVRKQVLLAMDVEPPEVPFSAAGAAKK